MLESAKRLLSKSRKQKEPLSFETTNKIIKDYGKDSKHLLNLRFVAMLLFVCLLLLFFFFVCFFCFFLFFFCRTNIEVLKLFWNKDLQICLISYLKLARLKDDSTEFIFKIINKSSGFKLDCNRKLSNTRAREILLGKLDEMGINKLFWAP